MPDSVWQDQNRGNFEHEVWWRNASEQEKKASLDREMDAYRAQYNMVNARGDARILPADTPVLWPREYYHRGGKKSRKYKNRKRKTKKHKSRKHKSRKHKSRKH